MGDGMVDELGFHPVRNNDAEHEEEDDRFDQGRLAATLRCSAKKKKGSIDGNKLSQVIYNLARIPPQL